MHEYVLKAKSERFLCKIDGECDSPFSFSINVIHQIRIQSITVISRSNFHDITYGTSMTVAKPRSDFKLTTDTPYLAITGELWGFCCKDMRGNWPRYNGTALYFASALQNLIHVLVKTRINLVRYNDAYMPPKRCNHWLRGCFVTCHDDVIKWKYFLRYCPWWGESTGDRWIPLTKASNAELWYFLWSEPVQTAEQTIETPVIWEVIVLIKTSLYCRHQTITWTSSDFLYRLHS